MKPGEFVVGRNKYHAKRTQYRGEWYASGAEANYAALLDLKVKAGEVVSWQRGKKVALVDGGSSALRISYTPDFIVTLVDRVDAIDVKGQVVAGFKIKWILWTVRFPEIALRAVDRDGNQLWPKLSKGDALHANRGEAISQRR